MQSPGRPDEDTRGGFSHGGWAVGGNDDAMAAAIGERMAQKYVASRSSETRLEWPNSTLLHGDEPAAVAAELKQGRSRRPHGAGMRFLRRSDCVVVRAYARALGAPR